MCIKKIKHIYVQFVIFPGSMRFLSLMSVFIYIFIQKPKLQRAKWYW